MWIFRKETFETGCMSTPLEIKTLRDKEKELMLKALSKTDWNLFEASRLLQIPVSRLKQKIRQHGLVQKAEI
jgi:transcriptional regulator of acetoin/glycerol metabolism